MRILIVLLLLALVLIGGFLWTTRKASAPVPDESATPAPAERTFSWRFSTTESEDGMLPPRTSVALITDGDVYDLGHYAGSCAEIALENLLPNEVAGVLCWWAGAGDELGIFREGERYMVRHGIQEEGTAETDGLRGNFSDLVEIR